MSKRLFKVYFVNIIAAEKRMLLRSFLLSESRQCSYQFIEEQLTSETRDGVVIIDDTDIEIPRLNMPMVILKRENLMLPDEPRPYGVYTLNRPLLATRVLRLLDKVVETEYNYAPNLQVGAEQVEGRLYSNRLKQQNNQVERKGRFSHVKALIIDDSMMIRKQMELILTRLGVDCDYAENGEEGILKHNSGAYDIVFLDIMMPGIDGFQTCKQLRKADTPAKIIMLTSKNSRLHKARGSFAGVDEYLVKPTNYEELVKVLGYYFL